MRFQLSVPMVPPSPNEMRRKYRHPKVYMNLRKVWETSLAAAAGSSEKLRAIREAVASSPKMRVQIIITQGGGRKGYDPDNVQGSQKVVLDALKNIGFLRDDSAKHIQLFPPKQIVGDHFTTDTLVLLETM